MNYFWEVLLASKQFEEKPMLRKFLWLKADFQWTNGKSTECFDGKKIAKLIRNFPRIFCYFGQLSRNSLNQRIPQISQSFLNRENHKKKCWSRSHSFKILSPFRCCSVPFFLNTIDHRKMFNRRPSPRKVKVYVHKSVFVIVFNMSNGMERARCERFTAKDIKKTRKKYSLHFCWINMTKSFIVVQISRRKR